MNVREFPNRCENTEFLTTKEVEDTMGSYLLQLEL